MNKKNIKLILLIDLSERQQLEILNIRNSENVRKWMYTDRLISQEEHFDWIERLKNQEINIVFAIVEDEKTLGVVSINSFDKIHLKAEWAFYLSDEARGGLGSAIEFSLLQFVFNDLKIEKLNCEVIEGNESVVKLHSKFLFKEEGFRCSNIIKNGSRKGVILLGITKNSWLDNCDSIYSKYSRVLEKFSIENNYNKK